MLGVKIVCLMYVITLIWVIIFRANCHWYQTRAPLILLVWEKTKRYPFWYWGLGLMFLLDIGGALYQVIYLLFIHPWGL